MNFPERFANLPVATWPRLRGLLDSVPPGGDVINMTIGEPQHAFPKFVTDTVMDALPDLNKYPNNNGIPELLEAMAGFLNRRYGVTIPTDRIMALNGTREGLYNALMAICPETKGGAKPNVLVPNPFYQVYAVAALSVAATPVYVPATKETGHLPDFAGLDGKTLDQTAVVYICSPANPQGAVADHDYWKNLFELAVKHDFVVFADECYSEVYRDTPPIGALEVAEEVGLNPERLIVFHSLSKRSNLAGMRSGFCVAGPEPIARIRSLRAYAGAPLPGPFQAVAAKVWADDTHVAESRALYQEKYAVADEVLGDLPGYMSPVAGFFLWLPVKDGETAALKLWSETGVRVLPGAYLSHGEGAYNPGKSYIRVALVAPKEDVRQGLIKLKSCLYG
ncbi:aminotransferase class I/II-fold pyridoxal phosphate-dependent enzyme [Cognatiyoonia sp.]|uniref:aminotransferase class I/II-fold pyridoxal phosphate-dependent enzyme n=1 Tax=Cognatiyoonia sp. TaxID=2211652 RepID=UPI003F69ABDC